MSFLKTVKKRYTDFILKSLEKQIIIIQKSILIKNIVLKNGHQGKIGSNIQDLILMVKNIKQQYKVYCLSGLYLVKKVENLN